MGLDIPNWSISFVLVVTLLRCGPGSVPAVGMCGVTLSFLLHSIRDLARNFSRQVLGLTVSGKLKS
jgi:hypothetical protein